MAIGGNGFENDTITSNVVKFRNKKVKLTIKAEAKATLNTVGFIPFKTIENCTTVEGEIMPETVDGILEIVPTEPPPVEIVQKPDDVVGMVLDDIPETEAEFIGGHEAMMKFFRENLIYPIHAMKNSKGGRVYLRFHIKEDGTITNVKVTRGILDCKECDDEAVRVIKAMPKWKPAETDGKPVSSWYNLPIKFTP